LFYIDKHFWLVLIYTQWRNWSGSEGRIDPRASKTKKIGHHLVDAVEFPNHVNSKEQRKRVNFGELTLYPKSS